LAMDQLSINQVFIRRSDGLFVGGTFCTVYRADILEGLSVLKTCSEYDEFVCGFEADTGLGGSDGFGIVVGPLFRCNNVLCRSLQVKQL